MKQLWQKKQKCHFSPHGVLTWYKQRGFSHVRGAWAFKGQDNFRVGHCRGSSSQSLLELLTNNLTSVWCLVRAVEPRAFLTARPRKCKLHPSQRLTSQKGKQRVGWGPDIGRAAEKSMETEPGTWLMVLVLGLRMSLGNIAVFLWTSGFTSLNQRD